jgi:hypothetical protein
MPPRATDHFTVSFEGPAQGTLSWRALEALETAYWRIGGTLSVLPTAPIPVVLYTTEQFRDITRSPAWAVAAFDGIIRMPMRGALERPKELDRVLGTPFLRMSEEQAQLAYASRALAAQRLLDEAGGLAITNLLRDDVGQGLEFGAAFAHRIQRSLAAFQAELDGAQ